MKAAVIQPYYSTDYSRADELFEWELKALENCDESLDLIVMPESCDIPAYARTRAEGEALVVKYNEILVEKAKETAKRCNALVFFNARYKAEGGYRNTTYAINRQGEIVGKYFKQHLVRNEITEFKLDCGYTKEYNEPYIVEIDGLRFAFLTCYDFYFYEAFSNIARQKVDIVIGCSHQRSDTHSALEIICRFLCYNTNAYLVRASVSMGTESPVGGCSCIVAPDGRVLVDMKSEVGMATAEFDPREKYFKPAGYGSPLAAHWEYIEQGRRPWKYRPAGSSVVADDRDMPYPRVCAHRGFNTVAPENSMPAYGAAVGLGAEEIEFDVWFTKDGVPVSLHDDRIDRVSDGSGIVTEMTYEELLAFDFGVRHGKAFRGLKILKAEEIFKKFAGQTIMNVHVKTHDDQASVCPYTDEQVLQIIELIRKYDCVRHAYIMTSSTALQACFKALAPEILLCCGAGKTPWDIVDRAIANGCRKVQLFKPDFNKEMIDKAHAHGITCNVFWADDPKEAIEYLEMGIDTILTNDYLTVATAVNAWKKENGR